MNISQLSQQDSNQTQKLSRMQLRLSDFPECTAPQNKAQIISTRPFAGKETIIFPFSLTLESGDYISIKSGTSGQFGSGVLIIMVSAQESL